ncbi:nucleoside hydrolase [Bacillus sp. JJ1562]|uniref:nucleoside hydrolase n=1 Tax=Bacillus sp. JJ1562 TaxID=3122960 RepID=UPI003002E555
MEKIILDVDTGIDDTLALVYAVRSPQTNVLGITTCFGNVSVENATENTLHVLELLDANIPVAAGAGAPIFHSMIKQYSTHFHGENGLANVDYTKPTQTPLSIHATEFIIEQIKKHPHEVTLICVGSLTNLALVILQEPEIVSLIKKVVIMGGAVTVQGNNQMHAEANIYADPEAADIVFKSGAPITLVGLDVTMKTKLTRQEVKKWEEIDSPLSKLLSQITNLYIDSYVKYQGYNHYCNLHDPLAVAVALDPSLVEVKPMFVQVDLEGHYSYGRTVPDLRSRSTKEPNMNVCIGVDESRFKNHFLHTIF